MRLDAGAVWFPLGLLAEPPAHHWLSRSLAHDCKRSFHAFTLDGVDLFVFEQRCREAAEFSVVLDDQYGSTFLLCLPNGRLPSWRSSGSTFNRRMSADSRRGSGDETMSANVARNSLVSVSGKFIRSNGSRVGRRIWQPVLRTGTSPRSRVLCRQCDKAGFVRAGAREFPFGARLEPHARFALLVKRLVIRTEFHFSERDRSGGDEAEHFIRCPGADQPRAFTSLIPADRLPEIGGDERHRRCPKWWLG